VTDWTGRELAGEAKKRGLIDSISASRVNRILREVDVKLHRIKAWCNTTETDFERLQTQVQFVCQTSLDAPKLYLEFQIHPVCVDETTSLKANERRAKAKPPKPADSAVPLIGRQFCTLSPPTTPPSFVSW
jgi:hypothetical protein